MPLAIAKKPSSEHHIIGRRDTVREGLKSSHPAYPNPQVPIIQLKLTCPCDGGCPRCRGAVQPKLRIGQPNDIYEQEADRVAEQVMKMPENVAVSHQRSAVSPLNELVQTKPG